VLQFNDILDSIKLRLRDFPQETRIRELYDRTSTAYNTDRIQGIKKELDMDWSKLKARFDSAMQNVKQETGLF
jgi:hypothetical protein